MAKKKTRRKKAVVHKKKKQESVHVRLDNPISKRKDILQTAVMTVELLKKYEVVRELRKAKVREMDNLRIVLSDIKKMTKDIKTKDESRLKKALRVFDISCFEDLKNLKYSDVENLESMKDRRKQTAKYKTVKSNIKIDSKNDSMDLISELDQGW